MIKDYVYGGHLIEAFVILPSISVNWMHKTSSTPLSWEINFAWLFWQIAIGNVRNNLKKAGY